MCVALAYYFVEDNEELIARGGRSLKMSLYRELGSCPCYSNQKFFDSLWNRMKSLCLQLETYKIIIHQLLFKPAITLITMWIGIIDLYLLASSFAPIVYIIYSPVFTKHYWCPLTASGTSRFIFLFIFFFAFCFVFWLFDLFAMYMKCIHENVHVCM